MQLICGSAAINQRPDSQGSGHYYDHGWQTRFIQFFRVDTVTGLPLRHHQLLFLVGLGCRSTHLLDTVGVVLRCSPLVCFHSSVPYISGFVVCFEIRPGQIPPGGIRPETRPFLVKMSAVLWAVFLQVRLLATMPAATSTVVAPVCPLSVLKICYLKLSPVTTVWRMRVE